MSRYASGEPTPRRRSRVLPFDEVETTAPVVASPTLDMPAQHALRLQDFDRRHLRSVLVRTYERAPKDFETLLGLEGVGGRTLRALALVSEVIYGTPASTRDPARFAFAHGGKDGTPFPVDRASYDSTIDTLHRAMARTQKGRVNKTRPSPDNVLDYLTNSISR